MRQVCAVTLLFLVYSAFVAGCDDSKAELDRTFVVSLKSKPRDQREGFVDKNKRKTITLTGSVKGVGSGGFGGSMVVFYLETRDAPREEMGGLDIAVTLDLGLQTVRGYRKTMMKKLGVNNVAGLTQVAIANEITKV